MRALREDLRRDERRALNADTAGPCRALWRAVIEEVLSVALRRRPTDETPRCEIVTAREWVGSEAFRLVCELADVSPDQVMREYRTRMAAGQTRHAASEGVI